MYTEAVKNIENNITLLSNKMKNDTLSTLGVMNAEKLLKLLLLTAEKIKKEHKTKPDKIDALVFNLPMLFVQIPKIN